MEREELIANIAKMIRSLPADARISWHAESGMDQWDGGSGWREARQNGTATFTIHVNGGARVNDLGILVGMP